MRAQILAQHRSLDALLEDVREAFSDPDARVSAREAFADLRREVETHFAQEERLYYPAIWGLRPDKKARLSSCIAAHADFCSRMEAIDLHLDGGEVGRAARAFEELSTAFHTHEALEEQVLNELDREISASG